MVQAIGFLPKIPKFLKMKKTIIFFTFFIFSFSIAAKAQKMFSTQYANQADLNVFVVKYQNQADLKVFKVNYQNQAQGNSGLWIFMKYANQATKKIFFVNHENQADLKIFFVKNNNQAGWNDKNKIHLLY